jgi:MFS family permease
MPRHPFAIAATGMVALAVAMGIGRFAFTPLLPMMLHDGVLGLSAASGLASANYLGYWLGALGCAVLPWAIGRWPGLRPVVHTQAVRLGLAATVVLTLGMALPWPAAWPLWRFLAGVASALVFVYGSAWCLQRLAAQGAPHLAGLIYVGPGLGITVSGLAATALVYAGQTAATGWLAFGVLALLLTVLVWPQLRGALPPQAAPPEESAGSGAGPIALLTLAYGLAGFGYIITATFLPLIARQSLAGSVWLDLFWPLFGVGVSLGALLTLRIPARWDRRYLLIGGYTLQAVGVVLSLGWPSLAGFALSSFLIGLPFTAITMFALQEVRRLRPVGASGFIGLLTAAYGLGQIAGPLLVGLLLQSSADVRQGFALALQAAAASLWLGVVLFAVLVRRYPATS